MRNLRRGIRPEKQMGNAPRTGVKSSREFRVIREVRCLNGKPGRGGSQRGGTIAIAQRSGNAGRRRQMQRQVRGNIARGIAPGQSGGPTQSRLKLMGRPSTPQQNHIAAAQKRPLTGALPCSIQAGNRARKAGAGPGERALKTIGAKSAAGAAKALQDEPGRVDGRRCGGGGKPGPPPAKMKFPQQHRLGWS